MKKYTIILIYLLFSYHEISAQNDQLNNGFVPLLENDSLTLSRALQVSSSSEYHVELPEFNHLTPNAAALQQYIDHPVSHFSGVPQINIPLYEIDVNGFKLPISISYHASGIKAKQEASWVGLGWSLNAGGFITRTVLGLDDFDYIPRFYMESESGFNIEFSRDLTFPQKYDFEADIFSFNINNSSGKFILGKDKKAFLLKTDQDVRIKCKRGPLDVQLTAYHHEFEITDESGITYKFQDSELVVSTAKVLGDHGYVMSPNHYKYGVTRGMENSRKCTENAWFLTEIILPNGEKIQFNYEAEIGASQNIPTLQEWYINPEQNIKPYTERKKLNISETFAEREQLLKEIVWSNGKIVFDHSVREDLKPVYRFRSPKKLEKIHVYNQIEPIALYSYRFEYEYFNEPYLRSTEYDKYWYTRLKLKSLHKELSNQPVESHDFFYDESKPLPPKHTHQYDHWGYFNSNTVTQKIFPRPDGLMDYTSKMYLPSDGADRSSSSDYIFLGLLNKIVYPTGGSCEFYYEQNSFFHDIEVDNGWKRICVDTSQNHEEFFEVSNQTTIQIEGFLENPSMTCAEYAELGVRKPTGFWARIMKYNPSTQGYTIQSAILPIVDTECNEDVIQLSNAMQEVTLSAGRYKVIVTPPVGFEALLSILIKCNSSYIPGKIFGGGVRIKEIKTDAKIRKFIYDVSNPSVAQLMVTPRYVLKRERSLIEMQSDPFQPLNDSNTGVYVGYSNVKEIVESDAGISMIEYVFDVIKEEERYSHSSHVMQATSGATLVQFNCEYSGGFGRVPNVPVHSNGLPLRVSYYDNEELKKCEIFQYECIEMDTTIYSCRVNGNVIRWSDRSFADYDEPWEYRTISGVSHYEDKVERWKLIGKIITNYETGGTVGLSEQYVYDNKFNSFKVVEVRIDRSDRKILKNTYKYPSDFKNIEPYKSMIEKNILSPVVERMQYVDDSFLQKKRTNYIKTDLGLFVPGTEELQKNGSDIELRLIYSKYDKYGNPVYMVKDDNVKVVHLWSYHGQYLIAKIANASYEEVNSALADIGLGSVGALSSASNPNKNILDQLRGHVALSDAMITTYEYRPLVGVTSITDPSKKVTYYGYDLLGRLKEVYIIKDGHKEILEAYEYNYAN